MLIWLLAILLFMSLGLVGYSLGVIRVGFSLLGLLVASLLAMPLGRHLGPVLSAVGVKNPLLDWFLGPFLAFLIVLIIFKLGGMFMHRKVDVYYKYKAGDLRMGLWNRINRRLGACLGMANAAVYLTLMSLVIYIFSYATFQMVTGDAGSWSVKMLNLAGRQLQSTGMAKVAAALDPMPESYYDATDLIGLIYHNDLLEGRLSRYPAYLALGERPEFQEIANDKEFTELRQKQPPIMEILDNPKAQNIINNPDLLKQIWAITVPDLKDLQTYLKTGQSPKYDGEKILGRWDFDLNGALALARKNKPNIASLEMQRLRRSMTLAFAKTTFIANPDKQAIMKNFGQLRPPAKPNLPPSVDLQTLPGQWSPDGGKYLLSFSSKGREALGAEVNGDKLVITGDTFPLVFDREY